MKNLLLLALLLPSCGKTKHDIEQSLNISDDDSFTNVIQLPPDNDDMIWFKMMKLQEMISELSRMIAIQDMRLKGLENLAHDLLLERD